MVERVQAYVPGYRLKQAVQFEHIGSNPPCASPEMDGKFVGLKTSVFLEVEGAAHYLPAYAGNLDIMTSAALKTAETHGRRSACQRRTQRHDATRRWSALHPGRDPARRHARHPPPVHARPGAEIARALGQGRGRSIEVAHGDGCRARSTTGSARTPIWEWIEAAAEVLERRCSPPCCCPGIGTVHDLVGPTTSACASVRVATHCTEADISRQHIEAARELGMDVARLPDDEPHERAGRSWPRRRS
jgi:hypothetical protein